MDVGMDVGLKLREIRKRQYLSQKDVARLSGVGEKTISSFETGQRIGSLKLSQLRRMLCSYGMSEARFFGSAVVDELETPSESGYVRVSDAERKLLNAFRNLSSSQQNAVNKLVQSLALAPR